jgi:hypothetical protein
MKGTNLQNKKALYNWREKNPEKYREISRKSTEKVNARRKWIRMTTEYLGILLEDNK